MTSLHHVSAGLIQILCRCIKRYSRNRGLLIISCLFKLIIFIAETYSMPPFKGNGLQSPIISSPPRNGLKIQMRPEDCHCLGVQDLNQPQALNQQNTNYSNCYNQIPNPTAHLLNIQKDKNYHQNLSLIYPQPQNAGKYFNQGVCWQSKHRLDCQYSKSPLPEANKPYRKLPQTHELSADPQNFFAFVPQSPGQKPKQKHAPKHKHRRNQDNRMQRIKFKQAEPVSRIVRKQPRKEFTCDQLSIKIRNQHCIVYNRVIGSGTYSKVYLGYHLRQNVKLAVKEVAEFSENQIRCLKSLDSPYVIKLKANWRDNHNKRTYLALELCERNLREQLKQLNRNPCQQTEARGIKYFDDVVKGIDALVSKQLVHRDLKFENILVSKEGVAKIADFGLAKDLRGMPNAGSLKCGTPYTMAPEILFHHRHGKPLYSHKCDIWSMGVILHEILYGTHPFQRQCQRVLAMDRVKVSKRFGKYDQLIDRCLTKDPSQRINWPQFMSIYQSTMCPNMTAQPISPNSNSLQKGTCAEQCIPKAVLPQKDSTIIRQGQSKQKRTGAFKDLSSADHCLGYRIARIQTGNDAMRKKINEIKFNNCISEQGNLFSGNMDANAAPNRHPQILNSNKSVSMQSQIFSLFCLVVMALTALLLSSNL